MTPDFLNLPESLRKDGLFCMWRYEMQKGRKTKVPYDPHNGEHAKTNDPSTFGEFEETEFMAHVYDMNGIGMYVGRGFSMIDIDHCYDGEKLSPLAQEILDTMQSYSEFSPSGSGLRIIFRTPEGFVYDDDMYYKKNPYNGVEVYVEGSTLRFGTVTGHRLENYPAEANDRLEALQTIMDRYMVRPPDKQGKKKKKGGGSKAPAPGVRLTDDQVIEKASRNENFTALFRDGDMSRYNNDHSSADLALSNILAFWTRCDKAQMDRLFRRSALMRDKWDEKHGAQLYSDMTLDLAIADCSKVYDPDTYEKDIFQRLDVPFLDFGKYKLTENGVFLAVPGKPDKNGEVEVDYKLLCATPLAPSLIIENLDTGVYKVEIHYMIDGCQRSAIFDREVLSNSRKVIALAGVGVDITTSTAKTFVDFFAEICRKNADKIPTCRAVSHLGWCGDRFLPYDDGVKFDGEQTDRKLFRAVTSSGTLREWVDFMRPYRQNLVFRLTMAAAFASPLIHRVGQLPFVFHLWGKSGCGKTVALKAAMSAWGNPAGGEMVYTMNMTDNAMMSTASVLHSIPFAGDELQLIKSQMGYDRLIMRITEGIDRGRMHFNEKLAQRTWHCAFLFTGEEPCTSESSGAGVRNRVVEIECADGTIPPGDHGNRIATFCGRVYGTAAPEFVRYALQEDAQMRSLYERYFHDLLHEARATDKQAASYALILTADELARQKFWEDDEQPLGVEDVAEYIRSDSEVSNSVRAEEYVRGWVISNQNSFSADARQIFGIARPSDSRVCVITSLLREALARQGFSFDSVKREWVSSGFIAQTARDGKCTLPVKIGGSVARCVVLDITLDWQGRAEE